MRLAAHSMRPSMRGASPSSALSSVLLPAPLGPTMAVISAAGISAET